MSERLTAEEIEQWRISIRNEAWFHPGTPRLKSRWRRNVLKALQHMIYLHDERKALQQKLLTPLAVILWRETSSNAKAQAWLQVVTALGITLKDVIEAIPPEMVRE